MRGGDSMIAALILTYLILLSPLINIGYHVNRDVSREKKLREIKRQRRNRINQ
jgi:hypothetical protein